MNRVIVDVREPIEFKSGHIEGAINIPSGDIMSGATAISDIPKDTEIILYCVSGSRASVAKNTLSSMGFTNIVNGINKNYVEEKYL